MDLTEISRVEKKIAQMLDELKDQIQQEVRDNPLEGVKPLARNMVEVSFSNLQRNVWSPDFYIQDIQANIVAKSFNGVSSVTSFLKKLREIVENKSVKIGSTRYQLNNNTLMVLEKYLLEGGDLRMIKWEDVTTYSRGDKERVPRVWQCKIADAIVIKVHRFHALQGWFLTCSSFDISAWNLTDSEDVEDAKKAALEYVRGYLEREIRDYQRCIEELDAEIRDVCYYQV